MKKLIGLIVLLCFMSNMAFANCDWTQIKKLPNGDYEYTPELHICVGQLVQDAKVKDQQIADLSQALTLKDLALTKADARATLWMDTSQKMEERLQKIDGMEKTNSWLYFGLGVAATVGAGWMASQLIRR